LPKVLSPLDMRTLEKTRKIKINCPHTNVKRQNIGKETTNEATISIWSKTEKKR
jgi:hypothetical protein